MSRPLVTSYEADLRLFPDRWHKVGLTLAALLVGLYPLLAGPHWLAIANQALVAIVGAIGLMILTGFAGQVSLGHAAFLALGAYTAGILGERLHVPFWLTFPAAGLVAAAAGLLVGPFALRLRGLYLAIVTLGLLFLTAHALHALDDWTHGPSGLMVPVHAWFGDPATAAGLGDVNATSTWLGVPVTYDHKLYVVFVVIALLAAFAAKNVRRSRLGRAMMAVRDHDLAASVLGVPPARTKLIAFALSSFLAGVAGAMYAFQQQYLTIEPFGLDLSVSYIAMIVLGGMGTVFGAITGALAFVVLSPLAEALAPHVPLVRDLTSGQQSTLFLSVVVLTTLLAEPLGLYGVWLRVKRYFVTWPFRY